MRELYIEGGVQSEYHITYKLDNKMVLDVFGNTDDDNTLHITMYFEEIVDWDFSSFEYYPTPECRDGDSVHTTGKWMTQFDNVPSWKHFLLHIETYIVRAHLQ